MQRRQARMAKGFWKEAGQGNFLETNTKKKDQR